jgi:hypothetical protein
VEDGRRQRKRLAETFLEAAEIENHLITAVRRDACTSRKKYRTTYMEKFRNEALVADQNDVRYARWVLGEVSPNFGMQRRKKKARCRMHTCSPMIIPENLEMRSSQKSRALAETSSQLSPPSGRNSLSEMPASLAARAQAPRGSPSNTPAPLCENINRSK